MQANWITAEIEGEEALEVDENDQVDVTLNGINVKKMANITTGDQKRSHFIFPSNETHTWVDNFFEIAWRNNLADRMILLI